MRITSLKIERFGVWENLNLPKVSRGLNVFFGPNEAGKTTLMQFIRTCLYGGGDEDRARYIQMALDGRRRRERRAPREDATDDPRRTSFAASLAQDGDSNAPEEIRRFLEAGKKTSSVATDAKSAARDPSRSWIGGAATVESDFGAHTLERRYIRRDVGYQSALERKAGFVATDGLANWSGRFYSLPGRKIAESLVVTGPDGARVGDYFAKSLTCNLDESTYNGVFAIGLDELQRLGMLNETEAAQMLYRLSVGVDRGAFVQVFQQIVAERNDIMDAKGGFSILNNLLRERDKARAASGEAATNLREYARLLEERRAVLEATKGLQERLDKANYQKRLRELALQTIPTWDERERARAELAAMGEVPSLERKSIEECDALLADVAATRAKIAEAKTLYRAKRAERDAIKIDPALDELAPRVSMLEEDLPRLTEIDKKVAEFRDELTDLNAKLAEEEQRVRSARNGKLILTQSALDAINASIVASQEERARRAAAQQGATAERADVKSVKLPNKLAEIGAPFKEIEDYKIPAKRIRRRRLRLQELQSELAAIRDRLGVLAAKLEQGLTSHSQKNLTEAIEKTGSLLSGLRRRIEIEKRVGEMSTYRKELERQNRELAENQAIVGAPLYALGAGFVLGGLLFGLSFLGRSRIEPAWGILGLLAAIACIIYKTTVENRNRQRLQDNQRRLGLLVKQLEAARVEMQSLDEQFPAPVGAPNSTLENRLQKAKTDLAFFESLVPVEAQWRETTKQSRAKEADVRRAEEALAKSHKGWRAWLRAACLPQTLKPSEVRDLFARVEIADDIRGQISALLAEIEYLGRERQGVMDRLDSAIALIPRTEFADRSPFYVVPKMRELLDEHASVLKARAALLEEMTNVKRTCKRQLAVLRRQTSVLRRFLASCGVRSREALVRGVERCELFRRRSNELDAIQQRLDAALGGFCQEEEIEPLLVDSETREELPVGIDNLAKRIEALDAELKGKLELSGRLGQQADAIAAKNDSIRARFDALALDLRLEKMARLWQSRAVAGQMMEDIRRAYEKERQPETLREASRYLKRLTNGLYTNIWTPLGEDALFVDASNGETLDVAALSRGTRELLFIAIRLALVVSFEKHGVQMPLIWDDVLVNFDYRRAATAAKLLYDFAKAGRQIFLFTCHEHICRLFLRLGVPVCVLPTSNDPKRRRFRILAPLKKRLATGEANLFVNSRRPVELGPNFVEKPTTGNAKSPNFAVDGTDFNALRFPIDAFEGAAVELRAASSLGSFGSRFSSSAPTTIAGTGNDALVCTVDAAASDALSLRLSNPGEQRVRRSVEAFGVAVDAPSLTDEIDLRSDATTFGDLATSDLVVNGVARDDGERPLDVEADSSVSERDERVAASRSVSFDGRPAQLRALSEVSPTFTSKSTAKTEYDVAADLFEPNDEFDDENEENQRRAQTIEGVDYVPVDESSFENVDSLDYDEWTKVFSDQPTTESTPTLDGGFLDFFNSAETPSGARADASLSSDDDEYVDDEDDDEDDDEEEEADEFDDSDDEEDEFDDSDDETEEEDSEEEWDD